MVAYLARSLLKSLTCQDPGMASIDPICMTLGPLETDAPFIVFVLNFQNSYLGKKLEKHANNSNYYNNCVCNEMTTVRDQKHKAYTFNSIH